MSSLDYELKGGQGYLQLSAFINTIFLILFLFADYRLSYGVRDGNPVWIVFLSAIHGVWFYLEIGILAMIMLYMGLFLWERFSNVQRRGFWLFVISMLYLNIQTYFGDWSTLILPLSMYIALFLFWLGLNLIYDGDIWFWLLSVGSISGFVVQFFIFNYNSFNLYYFVPGSYFDREVYFGMVKIGIEVLWSWGVAFRWYLVKTFRGIPVAFERKKAYTPYDPMYPFGRLS